MRKTEQTLLFSFSSLLHHNYNVSKTACFGAFFLHVEVHVNTLPELYIPPNSEIFLLALD